MEANISEILLIPTSGNFTKVVVSGKFHHRPLIIIVGRPKDQVLMSHAGCSSPARQRGHVTFIPSHVTG